MTNPASIGLSPSAFLGLAKRAPRSQSAWHKFYGILIRVGRTSFPTTAPTPTDDPDDPLNTAITVFKGLSAAIYHGFLDTSPSSGSPFANDGATLIISILPYFTSWITLIIDKVIVPGREPEFRENLAEVVSTLIGAFVGARTHPNVSRYIVECEAPDGAQTEDQTFFLSDAISALLFQSTGSSPTSRKVVLRQCFMALGYLIGQHTHYYDLPLYGQALYENLCAKPETFADLFLSCVIDAIGVLKAPVLSEVDFQDFGQFLALSYRALYQFLSDEDIMDRLMDTGYLRWTCEMMATISQLTLLRRAVKSEVIDPSAKHSHLVVSDGCVQMGYQHIGKMIDLFGAAIAREAYTQQAVLSLARMHHLVMTHMDEEDNFTRDASGNAVADFVSRTAPYLIYRSVLKAASSAQGRIARFLSPEVRATEKWKVYEEQLGKMLGLYEFQKLNPVTICDSRDCSHSDSSNDVLPSGRCSGCGVKYYCSAACQKADWDHRHREKCRSYQEARQSSGGGSEAIDSRDANFLTSVTHYVMSAQRHEDYKLVRHIDFTVCPPKVSLSYMEEEELAAYGIGVDEDWMSTPMSFLLPMGLSPLKRSGNWDVHALGMEAVRWMGGLAYNSEFLF